MLHFFFYMCMYVHVCVCVCVEVEAGVVEEGKDRGQKLKDVHNMIFV